MNWKNKWIIWMSIFLSIACVGGNRPTNTVSKTAGKASSNYAKPVFFAMSVSKPIVVHLKAVTTSEPETTTVTLPPAPTTEVTATTEIPTTEPEIPPETQPVEPIQAATIEPSEPACAPHIMSVEEAHSCWDSLIAQYDWNTTKAFNIMYCESQGNSAARNRHSTATGLFQILGGPTDPQANVNLAYSMYQDSLQRTGNGWRPWVCQ